MFLADEQSPGIPDSEDSQGSTDTQEEGGKEKEYYKGSSNILGNTLGERDDIEATDKTVLKRRKRLQVRFCREIRRDKGFKCLRGLGKNKPL